MGSVLLHLLAVVLPHVYLWSFLSVVAALVMHVQVATRFLATSPVLYWFVAAKWINEDTGTTCVATTSSVTTTGATERAVRRSGGRRGLIVKSRTPSPNKRAGRREVWQRGLISYFLSYLVVGCALFSNYYPWT